MENFNLRKFLQENKLTKTSRLVKEEDYIDDPRQDSSYYEVLITLRMVLKAMDEVDAEAGFFHELGITDNFPYISSVKVNPVQMEEGTLDEVADLEAIERMESLVYSKHLEGFVDNAIGIITGLAEEGFDAQDVDDFLEYVIRHLGDYKHR